jgi:hypothetical protein
MTSGRTGSGVVLGVAALAFMACVQPEVLALEHEVYEVLDGVETLVDSGCTELPQGLGEGFGFGFGTAPGVRPVAYSVSYSFENERVLVSAGAADGSEVTEREYDEAFLSSGQEVELADDFALRLRNRGVSECDTPGGIE